MITNDVERCLVLYFGLAKWLRRFENLPQLIGMNGLAFRVGEPTRWGSPYELRRET